MLQMCIGALSQHVDPFGGLFKRDVEIPFMYIVFLWYLAVAFFTVF